jgi:hypothetical protein
LIGHHFVFRLAGDLLGFFLPVIFFTLAISQARFIAFFDFLVPAGGLFGFDFFVFGIAYPVCGIAWGCGGCAC